MHQDLSDQIVSELRVKVLISLIGKPVFAGVVCVQMHHHLSCRTSSRRAFVDLCYDFAVWESSSMVHGVAFVDGFC